MIVQALVALPFLMAALLVGFGGRLPRFVVDTLTTLTVAVMIVFAVIILAGGSTTVWLGGWGEGVGIALVAGPLAVGLVLAILVLALAALIFSWHYLVEVQAIFHALMLLFTGAMCAFTLTGDLFDAFVFFELMSVAAYALTGYKSEEPASVHGALNFGVVNSLGAYITLSGIALIYARTGQLGFHAIGTHLHRHDALVVVAFALICTGFLVKAAAVPFHFWLADAHAVAPTPVCMLFSGIMVELGVYAIARTYWACFAGAVPADAVRHTLVIFGTATALLGGIMCVLQRHIKRLLAYSTIGHVGLLLTGIAFLDKDGLVGTAYYLLGHAACKAALFVGAGALLNRYETVDEHELRGRGRSMPMTSAVFLVGGLGLAGLPPSGTWAGKSILDEAGGLWMNALTIAVSCLTAGAVLRVWLRVFLGAGPAHPDAPDHDPAGHDEDAETRFRLSQIPWTIISPGLVLAITCLFLGLLPGAGLGHAATAFTGLTGPTPSQWTPLGIGSGVLGTVLGFGVALAGLRGHLPRAAVLHRLHSGHIGDYTAWLVAGVTLFGVLLLV